MRFVKMHGAGNDYVFVNGFEKEVDDPAGLARLASDRHKGIGGDGLIVVLPSDKADARMRIFNADGSEAEMCGNGIRCAAKLLFDDGTVRKREILFETGAGLRPVRLHLDDSGEARGAEVEMGIPEVGGGGRRPEAISVEGRRIEGYRVDVGNPHFVVFVDRWPEIAASAAPGLDNFPLSVIGPGIERHPAFPERTNVEFVLPGEGGSLVVRVWERGSGETMACGTGAVASAAAAIVSGIREPGHPVTVRLRGGDLTVVWDGVGQARLEGEASEVFRGDWPASGTRHACPAISSKNS